MGVPDAGHGVMGHPDPIAERPGVTRSSPLRAFMRREVQDLLRDATETVGLRPGRGGIFEAHDAAFGEEDLYPPREADRAILASGSVVASSKQGAAVGCRGNLSGESDDQSHDCAIAAVGRDDRDGSTPASPSGHRRSEH